MGRFSFLVVFFWVHKEKREKALMIVGCFVRHKSLDLDSGVLHDLS